MPNREYYNGLLKKLSDAEARGTYRFKFKSF